MVVFVRFGLTSRSLRSKRFCAVAGAKNEEQESKTARKLAQVKERILVSFIARSKPKIPFHGLWSLVRNQTETQLLRRLDFT